MQKTDTIQLEMPSLPKGGGAITGLKGDIASAGPDGAVNMMIPLPISAGRGYAPSLGLSYHSRAGNSPFGVGFSLTQTAIRRRTNKGVPRYDESDEFTGQDGDVLVPVLLDNGQRDLREDTALLGTELGSSYKITCYRSSTETRFDRIEYWVSESRPEQDFWVQYTSDGQVQLFGRNTQSRISHPTISSQTAVWLMESSVSSSGDQIYYQYCSENNEDCSEEEIAMHPNSTAQRYLSAAWYGNKEAGRFLPALSTKPAEDDWLFMIAFDYGERKIDSSKTHVTWVLPGNGAWACRQDPFSNWQYGFDVRTRRLCKYALMYHAVATLSGKSEGKGSFQLVSCLSLEYDENPIITTMKKTSQFAYELDGTVCELPPLEFRWQEFVPPKQVPWQQRRDMDNFNGYQPYQLVDLNGEGLAGILYRDNMTWWYRSPVRLKGTDPDAITWDKALPLNSMPALNEHAILADLNGDGLLEWVITAPGMAGRYDRTENRQWRHFTPLSALPVDYANPHAQLADITGDGKIDLVLIGPKSVRLYHGSGDGWRKVRTVLQSEGITLPAWTENDRVLVAFSDMAGSGQQHLVEVRSDGVRYWPNLGHGQFGSPIVMPGFDQPASDFNPDQLYLADVDGSGTTDLIYALNDHLLVYCNQSGNRFAPPFRVNLPDNVAYDRTCSLQLADIQGLGMASFILTIPHPIPHHWVCHLSKAKPWLLKILKNNMGATHCLNYRSSAQFWLDEKREAFVAGKPVPPCYLPFALHMLHRKETRDEISGNRLISTLRYQHGVWSGRENEFWGFGFVEANDENDLDQEKLGNGIDAPALSRNWYATGLPAVDNNFPEQYWRGDDLAFDDFTVCFTTGFGEDEREYNPNQSTAYWLNRSMRGMILRSEMYGIDGSAQEAVPYFITENRPQVRLIEVRGSRPVVWSSVVESRTYSYERIHNDPQCQQTILLAADAYGQPLRQVSIGYPRRSQPTVSPYSNTLPDTLFSDSFDPQQQVLRLEFQQNSWHTLSDKSKGIWCIGIADATRRDALIFPSSAVPAAGLKREHLTLQTTLGQPQSAMFAGQLQLWYLDAGGKETTQSPAYPPRLAFTETAILDEKMVAALSDDVTKELLLQAGYIRSNYLFAKSDERVQQLWVARRGYITYAGEKEFYLPISRRDTLLTGSVTVTWDPCCCVITKSQDAAGLTTSAKYDWRFLLPISTLDANDNHQSITLDALGRMTSSRFHGTENGIETGYSNAVFEVPKTAERALALKAPLPISQSIVYSPDSWLKEGAEKLPPHVVMLSTDRYDSDPDQQIRQQVIFSDGFGRLLQTAVRQEEGPAWQRSDEGSLIIGSDGSPEVVNAPFRWSVSGRTEYDNQGRPIRTYQPYFLNEWKYVNDDTARNDLYADTHYYDAIGREWQVKTAKGWFRRTLFTSWFVLSEDENDTVSELGNLN